jgi:hypothetical protein
MIGLTCGCDDFDDGWYARYQLMATSLFCVGSHKVLERAEIVRVSPK